MSESEQARERPKSKAPKTRLHASPPRKCLFCGKEFIPKTTWQKFCITKHKDAYWNIERILNGTKN